nr:hypothetical protein [uncultured Draconibacterium sp.]
MKAFLKKHLIKTLSQRGLTIDYINNKDTVESLINKFQPFATDKDLIRLGPDGDGGYLVPDDLDGIYACFSPGVGKLSEFELDCLKQGMKVFLADKSVDSPAVSDNRLNFLKKFIGPVTNEDYITMDDWVESSINNKSSDLILEMDIEKSEYLSILQMSEVLLKRFRIMIIEFHLLDYLWNEQFFKTASAVFDKILKYHTCVHIHPNNCFDISRFKGIEIPPVAEFTFLRNDRILSKHPQTKFPHSLDFDNTSKKKVILPKRWYTSIIESDYSKETKINTV